MKKLICVFLALSLLTPFSTFATTTVPWSTAFPGKGGIWPNLVNGLIQKVLIGALSTTTNDTLEVRGNSTFIGDINFAINSGDNYITAPTGSGATNILIVAPDSTADTGGGVTIRTGSAIDNVNGGDFSVLTGSNATAFGGAGNISIDTGTGFSGTAPGTISIKTGGVEWISLTGSSLAFPQIASGCLTSTSGVVGSQACGTVTSIATNNGLTGGTITTSGTIGLDITKLNSNKNIVVWDGANLTSTTSQLTVGSILSTTTATSTYNGGLTVTGGFVGVGTTTPFSALTVEGPNNVTGGITLSSTLGTTNRRFAIFPNTNFSTAFRNLVSGTTQLQDSSGRNQVEILTSNGNVGLGTSSPYTKLGVSGEVVAANYTATTTATSTFAGGIQTNLLNITSSTASSTAANGFNLSGGCYAINNTCIGGSSGSGTVSSGIAGQLGWYASTGTTISATGTQLTIGNLLATSTTATSTLAGSILVRGSNSNAPSAPLASFEVMSGRTNAGALNTGQLAGDIALQWGGSGGGYRHWITSNHDSVAGTGNSMSFYMNNAGTAGGSSAPGTGNTKVLLLQGSNTNDVGVYTDNRIQTGENGQNNGGLSINGNLFVGNDGGSTLGLYTNGGNSEVQIDVSGNINTRDGVYYNHSNQGQDCSGNADDSSGGIVTGCGTSDRKFKKNIESSSGGLNKVLQLRPVTFNWNDSYKEFNKKASTSKLEYGLIAQEVQAVLPEAVSTSILRSGISTEEALGLKPMPLITLLIEAIQEQQAEIDTLKAIINVGK